MIPRFVENHVCEMLAQLHKAILILVARQVGKTTLLQSLQKRLESQGEAVRYLNCDLEEERQAIDTTARLLLDRLTTGKEAIFIDEIRRLEYPGLTIKILVDLYPRLKILVTIVERYKYYLNRGQRVQGRFWRTYGGAEVDYIWKGGRMEDWGGEDWKGGRMEDWTIDDGQWTVAGR
jgi:predicted AAA+ superfamily ATPase